MNNKKRANLLFMGGVLYAILSILFMSITVINNSGLTLAASMTMFTLMTFSLATSMKFDISEDAVDQTFTKVAFGLLIPLWLVSIFFNFLLDIAIAVFPALDKDEGGDKEDERESE